jgi:hypothetical protein
MREEFRLEGLKEETTWKTGRPRRRWEYKKMYVREIGLEE